MAAASATGGLSLELDELRSFVPPIGGGERNLDAVELSRWCLLLALLVYLLEIGSRRVARWQEVAA